MYKYKNKLTVKKGMKRFVARRDYPDAYPKLCNKWWDGYNNQKHVIMDDIGPEHKVLGQQLKIWRRSLVMMRRL